MDPRMPAIAQPVMIVSMFADGQIRIQSKVPIALPLAIVYREGEGEGVPTKVLSSTADLHAIVTLLATAITHVHANAAARAAEAKPSDTVPRIIMAPPGAHIKPWNNGGDRP